jgi:hypothetical protein
VLLIGLADLCRATMSIVRRGGFRPSGKGAATNLQ